MEDTNQDELNAQSATIAKQQCT